MDDSPIKLTHEFVVLPKKVESVVPVPTSQWQRYQNRIQECGESLDIHQAFGWSCVGFASGAFMSAITFPASVSFRTPDGDANFFAIITEVVCVCLTLFAAGLALNSLWYCRKAARHGNQLRQIIVEDMQDFQRAYELRTDIARTEDSRSTRFH